MRKIFLSLGIVLLSAGTFGLTAQAQYEMPAGFNPGNFGPTGQTGPTGPTGQMGPSEQQLEMMQKGEEMQKAGEAKQKEAEAKALAKVKSARKNFERGINIIKKQVNALKAKGATVTEPMQQSLDEMDGFLAKIDASNDIDELQTLYESFGDIIDKAQENLQIMSKMAKFPSIEKNGNKQIADLTKQSAKLEAQAKRKGAAVYEALKDDLASLNDKIANLKTELAAMKEKVKTDPDTVFDEDVTNFFDNVKDAYENNIRDLNSSLNLNEAVQKQLPKYLNAINSLYNSAAKNKKFDKEKLAELKSLVDQSNTKFGEIKSLVKKKADMETISNAIDELTNTGFDFDSHFEDLTGKNLNSYKTEVKADPKDYQSPELENIIKSNQSLN